METEVCLSFSFVHLINDRSSRRSILFAAWSALSYEHYTGENLLSLFSVSIPVLSVRRWIDENRVSIERNLLSYLELRKGDRPLNVHGSFLLQEIVNNRSSSLLLPIVDGGSSVAGRLQLHHGIPSLLIELAEVDRSSVEFVWEVLRPLLDDRLIPFNLNAFASSLDRHESFKDLTSTIREMQSQIASVDRRNEQLIHLQRLFVSPRAIDPSRPFLVQAWSFSFPFFQMSSVWNTARVLLHPHYSVNIFLAVFYVLFKQILPPSISSYIFTNEGITGQDTQVLLLLATIITIRGRKALTWLHYVDNVCKYSKMANCLLFYREQAYVSLILFAVGCLLHFLFFAPPEPTGKTNILHYRANNLDNEIRSDPRLSWLVCFYAPWSPPCQNFSSVFVDLSTRFGDLKTFRFVKFDVNRYPAEATKFKIDTSTFSKQLPTVVLFEAGKEVKRRPQIDVKGRVLDQNRLLTADYLINEFGLAEIHTRETNKLAKKET